MKTISLIILLQFIIPSSSIRIDVNIAKCLSDLITKELTASYNYLQLSSKLGTKNAYPGFASLFMKLSDDDTSKSNHIVKFLALRKAKLDRLVNVNGVSIHSNVKNATNVLNALSAARHQNKEAWSTAVRCHQEAENLRDANVQDYLESELLGHHVKVDKLFQDFENRINEAQVWDQNLTIFMIDEELLYTYGDLRENIFS